MPSQNRKGEVVLRGIAASPGVCRGRALVLRDDAPAVERRQVTDEEIPQEIDRLEQALLHTRQEVEELRAKLSAAIGEKDASIFEVHLLILEDSELLNGTARRIREEKINADAAYGDVAREYIKLLASLNDPYFRERAADIRDVTQRVLNHLRTDAGRSGPLTLTEPAIIISHDLTPSATAQLDRSKVLGFATDVGSQTSHTAILARSLGIPAVVGLHEISAQVSNGQPLLLDGHTGSVFVHPTDQTLFEYGQLARRRVQFEEQLREIHDQPAITLDGTRVVLSANLELAEDSAAVAEAGADGVGLFRTEYLFLRGPSLPDEESQWAAYRSVAEAVKPGAVIIRTLDIGGDKFIPHLPMPKEVNPFLGWRAIRFCLHQQDLFRTQLRAILRASAHGNVKLMYPMISGVDELVAANALLQECRESLRREGQAFDEKMEVGAMIEIPSAVMVAESLAEHVDFFSIGTNDLIQYTLAIDRLNDRIAHLYEPTHPAVLRLIRMTVHAAQARGRWVGVCGEMAGDPVMALLLLGLGVDELSAAPPSVPRIKHLIRRCRLDEAKEFATWALGQGTGAPILQRAEEIAHRLAPTLFS
ncbi:MAG: phosphoenolpyruvate--protein phosphotransferase [Verrucomicrobiales bacterium]|nr:phosphoenolpyruvate--protein phosphotransferase [Verrucomicrobiales bacterium]